MSTVIENPDPVLFQEVTAKLSPAERELQLDIPSRTILRTVRNQAGDDWSYPNLCVTTNISGQDFVSWGWKLPGTAWGFLSVPMTWVLRLGVDSKGRPVHFTRAEPDREGQYIIVMEHGQISLAQRAGGSTRDRTAFFQTFRDMLRVRV